MDLNFFALLALTAGIVALIFGGLVILKDSRKLGNRLFFLMCLSVGMWGVAYWFWLTKTSSASQALFWVQLLTVGSLFSVLFFTHWTIITTKASGLFWSIVLGVTYAVILGFVAIVAIQPDLLIGPLREKLLFPLWPDAGPLYVYQLIIAYILPLVLVIGRVGRMLLTVTEKVERGKLLSILIGSVIGFTGGAINFFLWFSIPILPYGNFGVIVFSPIVGYSIVRYKLFTFRTVATELLVLFTVTGVFVQIFLTTSLNDLILQLLFFIAVAFSSYLLLINVYRGVKTREKLELLTQELKIANTRLQELDQQKSEFLSIATHQLRGPLAGIRGHLSLIIDGSYGKVPARTQEVIKKVLASSGLLAQTINDFLNVSRIEQGSMQYEMKNFELNSLVANIQEELVPLAKKRKLELSFTDECKGKCFVSADYGKLSHIFFNLIDNAIKYTEKGWVKIRTTVDTKKQVVRTEVSDSGIGLSQKEISGLFEKFVRASGASSVNVNGTGLGLYVARQMVEAHKGKVWVESKGKGEGSTFIVELPITSSAKESIVEKSSK